MLSPDQWRRVYWLSGSTCGGKTTVSSTISAKLNWNVYHLDDQEHRHRSGADAKRHPKWAAYSRLTGDPLWLQPVDQHVRDEELALDEQFELILEDLARILSEDARPLLYDGYVTPTKLVPFLPSSHHCFYLIATESFQRHQYSLRSSIKPVLAKTSDPDKAWANWMERDVRAAQRLRIQVQQEKLPWLSVDGTISLEETINRVIGNFESTSTYNQSQHHICSRE